MIACFTTGNLFYASIYRHKDEDGALRLKGSLAARRVRFSGPYRKTISRLGYLLVPAILALIPGMLVRQQGLFSSFFYWALAGTRSNPNAAKSDFAGYLHSVNISPCPECSLDWEEIPYSLVTLFLRRPGLPNAVGKPLMGGLGFFSRPEPTFGTPQTHFWRRIPISRLHPLVGWLLPWKTFLSWKVANPKRVFRLLLKHVHGDMRANTFQFFELLSYRRLFRHN